MAHGVWNAGFSRHSPPEAGGGLNLVTWEGANAGDANTQVSRVGGPRGSANPGLMTRRHALRASEAVEWSMIDAPRSRSVAWTRPS